MNSSYPDNILEAKIDLEFDFKERGGIQRFKSLHDFQAWITGEREFWKWLNEEPAQKEVQQVGGPSTRFWHFADQSQQMIRTHSQQWSQLTKECHQLEEKASDPKLSEAEIKNGKERMAAIERDLGSILEKLCSNIQARIHDDIVRQRLHLIRIEPEAEFVSTIASTDPKAAVHALEHFLGPAERTQWQFKGQMLATLFTENLNRKIRPDQRAFKRAIESWARELKEFKERYEAQESEFQRISDQHLQAEKAWRRRHDDLAKGFTTMQNEAENGLKTLKDTYDGFMQLEAPREYWGKKATSHDKGRKLMAILATISAVLGAVGLGATAWHLLPESQTSGTIPWRQIGFFVLASTFVLWIVKLLVRLMLSHIHLYEDAKEREVMISTFLALINHQESREGLKKEDIALVLAPIFRPSTTGVIKDDGGPQSFGDLLKALTGGK